MHDNSPSGADKLGGAHQVHQSGIANGSRGMEARCSDEIIRHRRIHHKLKQTAIPKSVSDRSKILYKTLQKKVSRES